MDEERGHPEACHGQMYNMNTLVRHGTEEQRQRILPKLASGELRLQSMGVTEPTTGTDTTQLKTTAVRKGDRARAFGPRRPGQGVRAKALGFVGQHSGSVLLPGRWRVAC